MFEFWGQIDWKSCFWKIWVEFKWFWKTFHLILMHFIHKTLCFEEILHQNALFFQKSIFSRFSIDRTCCLTNRKCNKNVDYNLPNSIGAWLVLDRSKLIFDQSNLIFDRSKIVQRIFQNKLFSRVLHFIQTFQKAFCSLSLSDPVQVNFFRFLLIFSQGFFSSSADKTFLLLLFHFIHIFHAF